MRRNARIEAILSIIAREEIETQEELGEALLREGYSVTQATISRDIRDLGLVKTIGNKKRYRYALSGSGDTQRASATNLFRSSVVSIRAIQFQIVIKTLEGNASNAGMIVDNLALPEVVGTVAGDDTLLIICEDAEKASSLAEKLKEMLN